MPIEEQKKRFEEFAHKVLRIPNSPKGKAYIEAKWEEGQKRKAAMKVKQNGNQ